MPQSDDPVSLSEIEPFIKEETTHEFDALNTLLLVVILGLCILSSYIIKVSTHYSPFTVLLFPETLHHATAFFLSYGLQKYKCYYIPESAATLLVGLVVGGVARMLDPSKAELDFLRSEFV